MLKYVVWHLANIATDRLGKYVKLLNSMVHSLLKTDPPMTSSKKKRKNDTWHLTHDMCHLTCNTLWEFNILWKFQVRSSYGLDVKVFWIFGGKGWVSLLINDEGVCRTAPAKGLLNMVYSYLVITIASVIRDCQMLFLNIKLHSQLSFFSHGFVVMYSAV